MSHIGKNNIVAIIFLILSCASFQTEAKSKLVDPESININQSLSIKQVGKAIKAAIIQSGWANGKESILNNETKSVDTSLSIRKHRATLNIKYTTKQIDFNYVSSINLKYKQKRNKQYIHANYMVWTKQLASQVRENIELGNKFSYEKAIANATRVSNPAPKESFSQFGQFKLMPTQLATPYKGHKGNESTQTNLDHNLQLNLAIKLDSLKGKGKSNRRLIIQPHIKAVKFVGTGARIWVGGMAGKSWMLVKLVFKDEATGKIIAEPELYRVAGFANGFSVSRADYKMVEDMALDISRYFENNYDTKIGGGVYPPQDVLRKVLK